MLRESMSTGIAYIYDQIWDHQSHYKWKEKKERATEIKANKN